MSTTIPGRVLDVPIYSATKFLTINSAVAVVACDSFFAGSSTSKRFVAQRVETEVSFFDSMSTHSSMMDSFCDCGYYCMDFKVTFSALERLAS